MKKLLLLFIFVKYLFAGCSSYIGSVTINEAYRPGLLSGGDPFIEFATVDGTDINESWKVRVYSNDNQKTYDLPADSCDDNDYKQVKLDDKKEIDTENGMSIALVDADGNYIDYLVMKDNDVEGHHGDCNWEFDSEVDSSKVGLLDDSDTYRDPDVTGDWISKNQTALMSQNNSDCSSNDGSSKIYVDPDADSSNDGSSCDEAQYSTINNALDTIRGTTDGPYTIKVCTGDYDEFLDLNDTAFDGLTIRGSGRNVNLNTQEDNGQKKDTMISINNSDIEKITFYNINFKHNVSCNSCDGSDGKFIFDFKKNKNSSSSNIKIGNIPSMSIDTCPAFNFSSNDFAGHFEFSGFGNFKSSCEAVKLDECDNAKESYSFSSMVFRFQSDKTDMFGFHFGDNVSKDCNISLENISLDMNKSSGIRFKERGDFSFDGFTFKNSSDDDTKSALKIEKLSGTEYKFSHFNIDTSGLALDFSDLNEELNLNMSTCRLVSRLNNGLVLPTIKRATLENVRILAHEQGMDLNVSEDLNITDSRLKSDKCGFVFRYGNPQFTEFHISSGNCKYSFKKTEDGITDTAFIHDSSFGLKQTGSDTFPLDWGVDKTFDLNNSCFCPKQKDDFGAIFRPWEDDDSKIFQANNNFWKYLPTGQNYDKKGFKDDNTLSECPHEEFIDACSKVGGFVSYEKSKRDDDNISNSNMLDQKVDITFTDINISSIDGTDGAKLIDFNGTVCARVIDKDSDSKMDWIKFFVNEVNTSSVYDFNSTFATQNAVVNFRWARNLSVDDTDCDDKLNTSEADSPSKFKILKDADAMFVAYTSLDENNVSDSNFTTKRVGKQISFTIASVDDKNSSKVKDFNGTVCYEVYDPDNNTSWNKLDFRDDNTSDINITLNFISKNANLKFKWQKNEDKDCADTDFDNNGTSLDKFAIIPSKFILDINVTQIKAGESYVFEINATDESNNIISDYNQTFSDSDKNITLWFRSKQRGDELNTTYNFNIIDGNFIKNDFNISNIGNYFIEVIDTDYANIDSNDTNLAQRTIKGDINISVVPYLFELNVTTHKASTNLDWLYVAQNWQLDMNYTMEATIKAKNKQNDIVTMFDKDEYATDINTTVDFDVNLTDEESKYYIQFDNDFNIATKEFNTTKDSFINGVRNLSLVYRIDKDITSPLQPIRTHIKDFSISNIGDASTNITKIDDNITWYYSRLKTYDIITTKDSINGSFFITIFKEDTKGFKELSLNWYKNDDNFTSNFDFNTSRTINIDDTTDHKIDFIKIQNSKIDFNITKNNDKNAIVHIKIPPYLWYSFGVDNDYNFSPGTNCSEHPCLNYTFRKNDTDNEIKSGNYLGGDIELKDRGNSTRLGVKVFR